MGLIYFICNRHTKRLYVGSTNNNPKPRIRSHFSDLRCRVHTSLMMQQDYDAYSAASFSWGILETVDLFLHAGRYKRGSLHHLHIAEQYYLYSLNTLSPHGYNVAPWPAGKRYGRAEFYFDWVRSDASELPFYPRPGKYDKRAS